MTNPFDAKWSTDGHTLCLGHWQITYLNQVLSLPEQQASSEMKTRGNFSWMFPDDDEFIEGLAFEDWIEENIDWLIDVFELYNIPPEPQYFEWFYQAVNSSDWTCNSCGGCI
jgi:hypothetical protein